MSYDAIIVGAGFSGSVMAERLASQLGWKVLILEKHAHIGGQCYDKLDAHGVRIHQYGPHLFHTDNEAVWQYLSQFTEWTPYEHHVLAHIDGKLIPLPFNLNSIDACFEPEQASAMRAALIQRFGEGSRVPILQLRKEQDTLLQTLAEFIYQKAFVNYTTKQWGVKPDEISPEVTARVPVVINRDDRYFTDPHQAIPTQGYTALFERLLDHPGIEVRLGANMADHIQCDVQTGSLSFEGTPFKGWVIYSGMIDEFFKYALGELPYRSLKFDFQHQDCEYFQPVTTVNYPNEHAYTRITEFKHLGAQVCKGTTIVYEYPVAFDRQDDQANIPYYPVFAEASQNAYKGYERMLVGFPTLMALGRLAQYRYFDMDDAVAAALTAFETLRAKL